MFHWNVNKHYGPNIDTKYKIVSVVNQAQTHEDGMVELRYCSMRS
jgi:hypothetical protein